MHRWTIFAVVLIPLFVFVLSFFLRQKMGSFLLSFACLISLNSGLGFVYRFPNICHYSFFSQRTTALKKQWKMTKWLRLVLQESGCFKWRLMMDGHLARKLTWRLSATRRICAWLCSGYDQDVFDLKKSWGQSGWHGYHNVGTFSCSKWGILFLVAYKRSHQFPLVGGFNPFEKIWVKLGIFPNFRGDS